MPESDTDLRERESEDMPEETHTEEPASPNDISHQINPLDIDLVRVVK